MLTKAFGIDGLSDDDCRAFPLMHGVYCQVSRMYFILSAKRLDYGLDGLMREEMIQTWVRELKQCKNHPAMRAMHRHAIQARNFNSAFLQLADEVLRDESGDSKGIPESDVGAAPKLSPQPPRRP